MNDLKSHGNYWAIDPSASIPTVTASMQAVAGAGNNGKTKNVAVIPLSGVITQHRSMLSMLGLATDLDTFGARFDNALNDTSIDTIVLDINSPGGSVFGVEEMATTIFKARGVKPIVAVVNSMMASAALHIGSAADTIHITPSGQIGSLGVVYTHEDLSGLLEKEGVAVTFIHAGEFKMELAPTHPLTEEAIAAVQSTVDSIMSTFVSNVAKFRGVSKNKVMTDFGQGRMLTAQAALKAGMVDTITPFDAVVTKLVKGGTSAKSVLSKRIMNKYSR